MGDFFDGIISQQDAQNQANQVVKENTERKKNGGLTDVEANARKYAAGAAALGAGLTYVPVPQVKGIGYVMQVPAWYYDIKDAAMGYDSAVHLAPDAMNAGKSGIDAVTKITPNKWDDAVGYTLEGIGIADNIDQAAGNDNLCEAIDQMKKRHGKITVYKAKDLEDYAKDYTKMQSESTAQKVKYYTEMQLNQNKSNAQKSRDYLRNQFNQGKAKTKLVKKNKKQ